MNNIEKITFNSQPSLMYANHCNNIYKPPDYTNA